MANEQLYSDPKLYNDGSGRGAVVNPSLATPELAMKNMQTRRPGGGAYVQLPGGPGKVTPNAQSNEEIESQDSEEQIDYLESLFNGENLSEEFMQKTAVIFEAAINEKISIIEQSIVEAAKEVIQEEIEAQTNALTDQLDNYLNYVITEWMEENKVAVERGLRTEIAEHFMVGLKELLDETYFNVPEDKYDIIDEMAEANQELQNQLNEQIKKNIELNNEVTARLCAESFMQISDDLTDTEIEKLATLAEGIEFNSLDQYSEKVKLLKDSYFNKPTNHNTQNIYEETTAQPVTTNNPEMNALVNAMSRLNRNFVKPQQKISNTSNAGRLLNMINPNIALDQNI